MNKHKNKGSIQDPAEKPIGKESNNTAGRKGNADSSVGKSKSPFGLKDKFGYLLGDCGNDFTFLLQAVFFLAFYTDVMGIEAVHIGTLLLCARIVDAFTDVGMGRLVDILPPSAKGRFRPWILRMCIPVALASTLMYMPFVVDASYAVRVTYMCVTYFIWGSVFYTSINIPYGSMAAVISDKPAHRSSLSVYRSIGAQLAFLFISAVLPQIVRVNNSIDPTRMAVAAICCGGLAICCYLLCYRMVEERIEAKITPKEDRPTFGQMIKTLVANRSLLALMVGALTFLVGTHIISNTTVYLWKDYFKAFEMMTWGQIANIVPIFILAAIATKVSAKWGKKELITIGLFISGALFLVMFFLKITNPVIFIVFFFFFSFGQSFYNVIIWATLTDVLDEQEVRTGHRDDGTIYAVYSWARKLGQALAGYLVGIAVSTIGYDSAAAKANLPQAQDVVDGIYRLYLVAPAGLYIVTALIMGLWYPLSKRRVEDNYQYLSQKKNLK